MKKIVFILLAITAVSLLSCSSGNGSQSAQTKRDSLAKHAPVYDATLVKGKVTDSVICKTDNAQNFALYLPSYYTPAKPFPCIYFFDAHARGAMPVAAYKGLAEKYGFIMIGSNISKNGTPWQVTNDGVKTLMDDTRARMNIDPKRIYTAGFSGGSRVASSVAIMDGGVAGVIGCSAGFPQLERELQNKFDYFGIVGDFDFNLTEMARLDAMLEQNGFQHQLLTTDNIHGWASASDFETGMLWMLGNGMNEGLQPKNDTLIAALKSDFDVRIARAQSSHDLVRSYELLNGEVRTLDGLANVAAYKTKAAALDSSATLRNAMALQTQLQEVELYKQQQLQNDFTEQDGQWWTKKIAEIEQGIRTAKTQQESQMNKRLLNYLGLLGYMSSDHALKAGDLTNAENYLNIFKMADPKNPDCSYLTAILYIEKGNAPEAISSLNEAASLGYSDATQLANDPAFRKLHDDPGFKTAMSKVMENTAAK